MRIYCAHTYKMFTKSSNYYKCHICLNDWYGNDPIPLVIIGQTDPCDVNPKYMDEPNIPDLSKKTFIRCTICKDLLGKRPHPLCFVKLKWRKLCTQDANGRRPYLVVLGIFMIVLAFVGIITMGWFVFHR